MKQGCECMKRQYGSELNDFKHNEEDEYESDRNSVGKSSNQLIPSSVLMLLMNQAVVSQVKTWT